MGGLVNNNYTQGFMPEVKNKDAENHVIGGLLLAQDDMLAEVFTLISGNMFHDRNAKQAFESIGQLYKESKSIDLFTTEERIKDDLERSGVDGLHNDQGNIFAYLGELAIKIPSSANIMSYAEMVKDAYLCREVQKRATRIYDLFSDGRASKDKLQQAQEIVVSMQFDREEGEAGLRHIVECLEDYTETLDERTKSEGMQGIPTGLDLLDEKTGGHCDSELIVVAGRPSMGKTTLALNMASHQATVEKKRVFIFSIEMPEVQIMDKLISAESGVDLKKITSGKLEDSEWALVSAAIGSFAESSIYIDDSAKMCAQKISSRVKSMIIKSGHKPHVIYIDYAQIMDGKGTDFDKIGYNTWGLKQLAKSLRIPIVLLAQVNRDGANAKPTLKNLKGNGSLEQDADKVIFIHYDGDYEEGVPFGGEMDLILAKGRMCDKGTVKASAQLSKSRFICASRINKMYGGDYYGG